MSCTYLPSDKYIILYNHVSDWEWLTLQVCLFVGRNRVMCSSVVKLLLTIICAAYKVLGTRQNCPALPGRVGRDGRDGKDCMPTQLTQSKGVSFSNPTDSCSDVIKENSLSSDGWYWVRDTSGSNLPPRLMLCFLRGHDKCGDGVWMRIGYFDTRQPIAECPDPFDEASGWR